MSIEKTIVGVAPYLDTHDLVVDITIGDEDATTVRVPIVDLVSDYITYNQELFSSSIAPANKNDALALAGLLRLCAKRIEETTV